MAAMVSPWPLDWFDAAGSLAPSHGLARTPAHVRHCPSQRGPSQVITPTVAALKPPGPGLRAHPGRIAVPQNSGADLHATHTFQRRDPPAGHGMQPGSLEDLVDYVLGTVQGKADQIEIGPRHLGDDSTVVCVVAMC